VEIGEEGGAGGGVVAVCEFSDLREEAVSNRCDSIAPRSVGGFGVAVPADLVATAQDPVCGIYIGVVVDRFELVAKPRG